MNKKLLLTLCILLVLVSGCGKNIEDMDEEELTEFLDEQEEERNSEPFIEVPYVRSCHERGYDGNLYPDGLCFKDFNVTSKCYSKYYNNIFVDLIYSVYYDKNDNPIFIDELGFYEFKEFYITPEKQIELCKLEPLSEISRDVWKCYVDSVVEKRNLEKWVSLDYMFCGFDMEKGGDLIAK